MNILPEFVSQSYYHIKLGYYTIGVGFELHSQYNIKKNTMCFLHPKQELE